MKYQQLEYPVIFDLQRSRRGTSIRRSLQMVLLFTANHNNSSRRKHLFYNHHIVCSIFATDCYQITVSDIKSEILDQPQENN